MDGRTLSRPFVITAIGDEQHPRRAMEIIRRGETVRRMGGDTTVLIRDTVDITALRPLTPAAALPENQASPSNDQHPGPRSIMSDASYPTDPRYTPEHEWGGRAPRGHRAVGITSLPKEALGEVVHVSAPEHRRRGHRR